MGNIQCCQAQTVNTLHQQRLGYEEQYKPPLSNSLLQLLGGQVQNRFYIDFKKQKGIENYIGINVQNLGQFYQILQKINHSDQENQVFNDSQNRTHRSKEITQRNDNQKVIDLVKQALFQLKKKTRKNIKALEIDHAKNQKNQLDSPYFLPWMSARSSHIYIYTGEWRFETSIFLKNIPNGIGRLYFNDQIWEGQFQTSFQASNDMDRHQLLQNLSHNDVPLKQKIRLLTETLDIYLNGVGRKFNKEEQYSGVFSKNLLNGKGQYKNFTLQYSYDGYWKDNIKEGKGTQITKLTHYQGDFKSNKKQGSGILVFYISANQQKQRQAQQKRLEDKKQNSEEAAKRKKSVNIQLNLQWVSDRVIKKALNQKIPGYKGQQLCPFKNSTSKEQPFTVNLKYEQGVRNHFLQKYSGQFLKDLFHGQGTYMWSKGNYYTGQWFQGKMEGYGKFYWKEGYLYSGQYKNDLKHGKGQMVWDPYRRYRGHWAFGQKHGYGQQIKITKHGGELGVYIKSCLWNKNEQLKKYWQKFFPFEQNTASSLLLLKHLKTYTHQQLEEDDKLKIISFDAEKFYKLPCQFCYEYFEKQENSIGNIFSNMITPSGNIQNEKEPQPESCRKCSNLLAELQPDKYKSKQEERKSKQKQANSKKNQGG